MILKFSFNLHAPKDITAGLDPVSMVPEIGLSLFDCGSVLWGSMVRVKLPYLSPDKVVCGIETQIIASVSYTHLTLPTSDLA